MAEQGEGLDQEDDAERRIARARYAIGKSFEELIARGEAAADAVEASRVQREEPEAPAGLPPATGSMGAGNPDDIAASVERRVSAWVDGRVRAAERRLELQSEAFEAALGEEVKRLEAVGQRTIADDRAAIEARFSAAEATLRSRLGAAVDESATEQDRRIREEAAAHRKRINEELAAALQTTATELRRRLEADREGARREFSHAARDEISAAVERLDKLHSAAVREAREAAEAVATARLADAESQIARRFEASREESKGELERGISGIDSRLREMFEELRGAQEAAGATREDEIRRRSDARIEELAAELSSRVEHEVGRKIAEAQAHLERSNAEWANRAREEARAGAEAAVSREVAKGVARIAAAAKSVDLVVEKRVAEEIAAVEQRMDDQLASRQLEGQRILEWRLETLGTELSEGLAAEAARAREELTRSLERGVEGHLQAFRAEVNSSSYQDHNRRAEAAATAQLARSLEALKEQQAAARAEIASTGTAERDRIVAERTSIEARLQRSVEAAREELWMRVAELRAAAEQSVEARVGKAIDEEFEQRASDLELRLNALATRREQGASMRLSAAAEAVEARLAAVDEAQEREERIRVRMSAAEREADQRVRDAEQRLVEVLARIDVVDR